jgi:hypothetical protein
MWVCIRAHKNRSVRQEIPTHRQDHAETSLSGIRTHLQSTLGFDQGMCGVLLVVGLDRLDLPTLAGMQVRAHIALLWSTHTLLHRN